MAQFLFFYRLCYFLLIFGMFKRGGARTRRGSKCPQEHFCEEQKEPWEGPFRWDWIFCLSLT